MTLGETLLNSYCSLLRKKPRFLICTQRNFQLEAYQNSNSTLQTLSHQNDQEKIMELDLKL